MHKISVLGHFGFKRDCLDGQTIKTKIVTEELQRIFGKAETVPYDTYGGMAFLCKMPFVILRMTASSRHIIIMPGKKGLCAIMPFLRLFNSLFRRRIHYVVIGGWLPAFITQKPWLIPMLKKLDNILVETKSMKDSMAAMGFGNVTVMPNCKRLDIAQPSELRDFKPPYPLCTFSRVIKEKGIEDAIEAVKRYNEAAGHTSYTLDIYGQIGKDYQQDFDNLIKEQPACIRYCGYVDYSDSPQILRRYFALLFPTYYEGECFAGTIIDAFSAGLPVIASDWHDNGSIITDGETGLIFPTRSVEALTDMLDKAYHGTGTMDKMRRQCLAEAGKYQPDVVVATLAGILG